MKNLKVFLLIAACAVIVTAQTKLGPKDETQLPATDLTRLTIGDEAPDFTLEDQDGKAVTLSNYRGKKSVVLVFYRGYW